DGEPPLRFCRFREPKGRSAFVNPAFAQALRRDKRVEGRKGKAKQRINRYSSPGLTILKVKAATAPPARSATMWIQIWEKFTSFITPTPTATAGLKAPPEMAPTANAPTITVMPIASP